MAKWGRRGWRLPRSSGSRMPQWSGRPFSKIKTVSWGSRGNSAPYRPAPKKWGIGSSKSNGASGGLGSVWGSRPQRPRIRRRTIFIVVLVVMMVFSIQSFVYIEKNLRPPLMAIAKIRVKQIATQAINKAITEQVASQSDSSNLIDWKMNSNGKISGFMLNYAEHMRITSQTINTVQNTLNDMKDIPEHIPIGQALNSAIISSYGPRVPFKFEPVGAVKVDLSTRQKDAGINMILVEVYIRIIAEVTIIIPFDTDPQIVETDIPISYLLVVGDVPMYYYDNTGKPVGESAAQAPNISVPIGEGVSSNSNEKEESSNSGASNSIPLSEPSTEESSHSNSSNPTSNNGGGTSTE